MVVYFNEETACLELSKDVNDKPYEIIDICDLIDAWEFYKNVVKCKECQYTNGIEKYCSNDHWVTENSYCSDGERVELNKRKFLKKNNKPFRAIWVDENFNEIGRIEPQTKRYYKKEDIIRVIDNVKNGYGMTMTAEEIVANLSYIEPHTCINCKNDCEIYVIKRSNK